MTYSEAIRQRHGAPCAGGTRLASGRRANCAEGYARTASGETRHTGERLITRHDAALLLSHVTGASLTEIAVNPSAVLTGEEESRYLNLIGERLKHVPLQYLLGKWQFMGFEFIVNPHVLIPRQDTEILVEAAVKICQDIVRAKNFQSGGPQSVKNKEPFRILDLCTGSGCIGVSLAKLTGAEVTASDISAEAIAAAKQNAELNGVSGGICFIQSDLFDKIPNEKFDMIISNPPYIPSDEIGGLQEEVRAYEPLSALDGGADGLDFYRRIIPRSREYLTAGGTLLMETGPEEGARELFNRCGYKEVVTLNDLAGLKRAVCGKNYMRLLF